MFTSHVLKNIIEHDGEITGVILEKKSQCEVETNSCKTHTL